MSLVLHHHHLNLSLKNISFAPSGGLYSSPTTPEAVVFRSKLCGIPLSIMGSARQAHEVSDSLSPAGNGKERDNTK